MPASPDRLLGLTAQIVAAHIGHTPVAGNALPGLIRQVHAALAGAGRAAPPAPSAQPPAPRRTIYPDYLICLEDGRKMKTLKRHLRSNYGMTPEQYREKWHLAADYPMVAPSYAERRSTLAREAGLGRRRAAPETAPAQTAPAQAAAAPIQAEPPPERETPAASLSAAHVFARFAGPSEPPPDENPDPASEPDPALAGGPAGRKRQPFAQQRTRTMGR